MVGNLIKDGTFPYQLFVGLKNISNVFILNATMMSIKDILEMGRNMPYRCILHICKTRV